MIESSAELRVALVLSTSTGGLPHYTAELANALSESVSVTVLKPVQTTADDIFSDGVELIEVFEETELSFVKLLNLDINPIELLSSFKSYKNIVEIREVNPDVVHFTDNLFPPTKGFAGYHGVTEDYPSVVTFHEIYEGPLSGDEEEKQLYRNPGVAAAIFGREVLNAVTPSVSLDRFVVHTEKNERQLISKGRESACIDVIPHGAYNIFGGSADDIDTEEDTILFFGKLVPSKDIETVVKSIPEVAESIPNVTLIIAGEGQIPDEAQRVIEEYPEHFEVRNEFIPNEEVGKYFSRATAIVVPHKKQSGHSGTLTIAFDSSKPIVATQTGDIPRLVEEEGCGICVPAGSTQGYADAFIEVLRDDDLRAEMSENSHRMAEKLSWDSISEQYLETYRNAIKAYEYRK